MVRTLPIATLAAILAAAPVSHADNLWDIYQLARQSDPQLREADANRMAVKEAKPQALGALLPQISATGDYGQDETSSDRSGVSFGSVFGTTVSNNRVDKTDWGLQLRQTVFRWDQWVKFRQSDKQALQADMDYRVAELSLSTRVADAYFNVLAAQDTLAATVAAREAIGRQLEQAQKRFEVGLIAITDVQEAQSGYDQAVAVEIVAKRSLANSNEVLREIVGDYPGNLAKPKEEVPLIPPEPADENQWVEVALQQNMSLQSAQLGADIARDNIKIARSGHLPTVDLVLSRNDVSQDGSTNGSFDSAATGRSLTVGSTTFDQTVDSITLQATLPIFSGGTTNARVNQSVYQHRAAKERLERTARQTERATRDAYLAVNTEISRVKALKQALKSTQTALQATEAGFEVGTRTTVDVLEARRQLYQAETNYARSRYDYIVNVLKLKEAAGILTDADLQQVNSWLAVQAAASPATTTTAPAAP